MGTERTEAPTPKRKRESRRKGQIARSPEVVTWVQILAATVLVRWSVSIGSEGFGRLLDDMEAAVARPEAGAALALLGSGVAVGALALAPLIGGLCVVGILGHGIQTGFAASPALLRPKWERVSPGKGLKRMISPAALWEAVKALVKIVVLTFVAWGPLRDLAGVLAGASRPPAAEVLGVTAGAALDLMQHVALAGLVVAGADYAYQRRRMRKSVMMTRQEVRDEHRQSEGDPQMKGQIRRRQMEMSRNRMMADVAGSTVVLVNPTHIAVALRYAPGSGAPRVVAKGSGAVAASIRAQAERHGVPIVTDRPLARAVHGACRLGQEVPAELYEAVARVLAFVFSLKRRAS